MLLLFAFVALACSLAVEIPCNTIGPGNVVAFTKSITPYVEVPASVITGFEITSGGADNKVTGCTKDDFEIYEDLAPISPNNALLPKTLSYASYLILVDISDDGSITPFPQANISRIIRGFLSKLDSDLDSGAEDSVSVALFDGDASYTVVLPFTPISSVSLQSVEDQIASFVAPDPASRNLDGAIVEGTAALTARVEAQCALQKLGYLVTFTSGPDTADRVDEPVALAAIDDLDRTKYKTFAFGINTDSVYLGNIGKDGSTRIASWTDGLETNFGPFGDSIITVAKDAYLFGWCSPKRSGIHTLTLKLAGSSPLSGNLTASFSAEGFATGCSAAGLVTPTVPCARQPDGPQGSGLGWEAIVGIVVGSAAGICICFCLIGILVYCFGFGERKYQPGDYYGRGK